MSEKIICALDMGSSKIKALIAKKDKNAINLVSKIERDSEGIKRGEVVDLEKTTNILKNLFSELEKEIHHEIDSVFLGYNASSLFPVTSHGLVSVSRADGIISEEDVDRVIKEAQAVKLPSNKEIFEILEKEFIIDGQPGIQNPVGLKGVKLEAKILAAGIFSPSLKNLKDTILNLDIEIANIFSSPLALPAVCLTDSQKDLGVCLLDMGAQTSSLIFLKEGKLFDFSIFPFGASEITKEIAIFLKVDYEMAERIKIEYGNCLFKGKDKKERVEIGGEVINVSQKKLSLLIQRVLSEMISEFSKVLKERKIPAGLVITGGGAKLEKIADFFKQKTKLPCRIGFPLFFDLEDPAFSLVAGVLYLASQQESEERGYFSKFKKFFKKIFS